MRAISRTQGLGAVEGLLKKMNIEHRTSNIECWMKDKNKGKYLNDILKETEELIKIFVTSIKTAEKKQR